MTTLIVIAKECLPGKVKTRLHPPFSLAAAAEIAAACLDDTLRALDGVPASRRILYFDGSVPPPRAEGYELVPQAPGPLDERIAAVFDLCEGPALLVGMDTPQLNATLLAPAFEGDDDGAGAWFGPATDGGFWALGLARPDGDLIRGVPMSRDDTGRRQLDRLQRAGLRVALLPELTDVDTAGDLLAVARAIPGSATDLALRRLAREPGGEPVSDDDPFAARRMAHEPGGDPASAGEHAAARP